MTAFHERGTAPAGGGHRPRRRRRSTAGTEVRLAQPLWVSGECGDPAVGRFAGLAAALHVSSSTSGAGAVPVIRYCVIDEARQAPVWVEHTDVHETRWLPDRARARAPDLVLATAAANALEGEPRSG
jgi:hypothetical protein